MKSSNPRPKGSKLNLKRRNKTLAVEVCQAWDRKIPRESRGAIWPLVLSSLCQCLASYIGPDLTSELSRVTSTKDLKGLISLKKQFSSPQMYRDDRSYFASVAVLNLFAKTELPVSGIDSLATAVERFREAEKLCGITNRRLMHYRQFDHTGRPIFKGLPVHEIFHLARRKIQSWLGPVVESDFMKGARHGPGGVVGLKRPSTTPYFKFAKQGYTCSRGAYWYAIRAIASNDAWIRAIAQSEGLIGWEHDVSCIPYETKVRLADSCITITDFNEVTFVPKDALTKRSISVEPQMNVYIQLGVGEHLKRCLRSVGCDLSDQTRNQELAYVGSVQHEVYDPVTLDMRMASDTLSIELVRELLPLDWFELLDDLRSTRGSYRGESFEWEKFSSMGNGFTFELESLIFLALAHACSDHYGATSYFSDTFGPAFKYAYVSVFGDDLIVPAMISEPLTRMLRFAGFQLNSEKSFTEGPFRESCGQDFWNGVDVRPFFFKRDLTSIRDLVHLHNGLKWLSTKFDDDPVRDCYQLVRSLIPTVVERHLRGVVPTQGDEYLWCEPDEAHLSALVTWHIHWQKWQFPVCGVQPRARNGQLHWRYVQFLYSLTDRWERNSLTNGDDVLQIHFSSGGSRGDVVESGRGDTVLRWR